MKWTGAKTIFIFSVLIICAVICMGIMNGFDTPILFNKSDNVSVKSKTGVLGENVPYVPRLYESVELVDYEKDLKVKIYYLDGDSVVYWNNGMLINSDYISFSKDNLIINIPYHSIKKFVIYK